MVVLLLMIVSIAIISEWFSGNCICWYWIVSLMSSDMPPPKSPLCVRLLVIVVYPAKRSKIFALAALSLISFSESMSMFCVANVCRIWSILGPA